MKYRYIVDFEVTTLYCSHVERRCVIVEGRCLAEALCLAEARIFDQFGDGYVFDIDAVIRRPVDGFFRYMAIAAKHGVEIH